MVENAGEKISSEIPTVDQMIDQVVAGFRSKEVFTNKHGRQEGYCLAEAADDIVIRLEGEGHDIFSIVTKFFKETFIKPSDIFCTFTFGDQTNWKEFCADTVSIILWMQTSAMYPEIKKESNNRLEKYSEEDIKENLISLNDLIDKF